MLKEFKDFLMKGNIVELAVAFVMGVAFAAVVNSFVNDLIMPIIAMIIGKPSFNDLTFTINDAVFRYGAFITAVITFVAIAAAVFFFVVKPMDAIKARTGEGRRRRRSPTRSGATRSCSRRCASARGRRRQVAERELDHSSASRPTVSPGGRPRTRSSASSTPGTNASREVVSWRIVRVSPGPPRMTSWCATRPGRRTEWIGTSPPMRAAVALAVPDGASSFVSACSSMISASGNERAASAAKRIIRTAPSAKFGATKHGIRCSRASRSSSASVVVAEAGRPDHARHAGRERRGRVAEHGRRAP